MGALTLYDTTVASATLSTACQLSDTLGTAVSANNHVTIGANTVLGWGELASQGGVTWAALGSEPAPSDRGWLYDTVALEGQNLLAGTFTPKMRLAIGNVSGTITIDLRYRLYKRSLNGTKTLIQAFDLVGQVITNTNTTFTFPSAVIGLSTPFSIGDKIYKDCVGNITANNTSSGQASLVFLSTSVAQTGVTTAELITGGITVATPPTLYPYKGTYQFTPFIASNPPSWFDSAGRAVNCPWIVGGNALHYWSEVEGSTEGVRDWTPIETEVAAWAASGKKTIIRISASDLASFKDDSTNIGTYNGVPNVHSGTPMWLYNNYAVSPIIESSLAAFDTLIPPCWNSIFQTKYQAFITAFGAQYDNDPRVSFVQIGVGNGGETLCDQNTGSGASKGNAAVSIDQNRRNIMYAAGYTDVLWWTYMQWVIGAFQAAFTHTPLILICDLAPFLGNLPYGQTVNDGTNSYNRQLVLNYLDALPAPGIYAQMDKLTNTQTLNSYWYTNTNNPAQSNPGLIAEQVNAAIANGRTVLGDLENAIHPLKSLYSLIYGGDLIDANLAVPGQAGGVASPTGTSAASLAALQYAQAQVKLARSGLKTLATSGVVASISGQAVTGYSGVKSIMGSGV